MMNVLHALRAETKEELEHFCMLNDLSILRFEEVQCSRADAHWMLDNRDGIQARCSLWWSSTPQLPGQRVGILGHYAARTARAASLLLQLACAELAHQGCTLAVGPLDGSTNRRYRFLTERGTKPLFFLEPDNPDDWPEHFAKSGFVPLANYYSALQEKLAQEDPLIARLKERFAAQGMVIRGLDAAHFEDELRLIYKVAAVSFRDNFLASPLSEADFLEQYRPLQPFVRPELVLLAEREGETIGFMFALPDWLQARREVSVDTVIAKTLAVLPAYRGSGLGTLLMGRSLGIGHNLGYTRAIHALMHENNHSRRISKIHQGKLFRKYVLYAKTLEIKK
jgi:GNAT superfamily N-acetyltransferase